MLLPNKSNDQQKILYAIQKNNVIVDSIAGSGKTATILHIANEFQDKNILLLTYNKRLKFEIFLNLSLILILYSSQYESS